MCRLVFRCVFVLWSILVVLISVILRFRFVVRCLRRLLRLLVVYLKDCVILCI